MSLPLHKTIRVAALTVTAAFLLLLGLGVRQYQLYSNQAEVSRQSEKLLFRFLIIREQVTELLLDGQYQRLSGIAADLEDLSLNLTSLLKDRRIDDQYRLGFANGVDLSGLVLLAKKAETSQPGDREIQQLNRELRSLGERLMLFDRMLVEHARRGLIGFQNVVIGALALVVSMIIGLVLGFQKRVVRPLLDLRGQVREVASGARAHLSIAGIHGEISELAYGIHDLLVARESVTQGMERFRRVVAAINKARRALAEGESSEMLFKGVCRALLANHDYCLVWIGQPAESGMDVIPVSADGSTTMTCKECESCVAMLLTEAEERGIAHNPAAQAMRLRRPVVLRDLLREAPRGLLKGTPLANGEASCAALPVTWQGEMLAVLSVYAATDTAFEQEELEMLAVLAADLGLVLHLLAEQQRAVGEVALRDRLLVALGIAELIVTQDGVFHSCNPLAQELLGMERQRLHGRHWRELLCPMDPVLVGDEATLLKRLQSPEGEDLLPVTGNKQGGRMRWRMLLTDGDGAFPCMVLAGWPAANRRGGNDPLSDQEMLLPQAVIDVVTGGVSHEISDLSNGMINYAQVLADEEQLKAPGAQPNPLLAKVIAAGERIAAMVSKLIFYGREREESGEFMPATEVMADALLLCGYQLKSDGIQLDVRLPEELPSAPVRAQTMQRVLVTMLDGLRCAMNRKIAGRSPLKRLEVIAAPVTTGNGHALEIRFVDHSGALAMESCEVLGAESIQATIGICRRAVEEQGGTVLLHSGPAGQASIAVVLPVRGE